jgi:formylmethanofuran dehydrogenase subunit E
MNKIISIPFKGNSIEIENIINISKKLNKIKEKINDHAYTYIELENNIYNYKNKTISASFYVKTEKDVIVECPVCYDNTIKHRSVSLNCNHTFCKNCYNNWNNRCQLLSYKTTCPLCRQ